jgi:hypothetical protein
MDTKVKSKNETANGTKQPFAAMAGFGVNC